MRLRRPKASFETAERNDKMEPEELELPSAPAATPRSDIADAPPPPPDITDNAPPPPPPPPDTTGASQAAQALLDQAKLAESRGDDDQAIKLVALSLKTYELEEAEALQKYLEAFGTGSAAAQTVQKMLEPRASYYQIMKLSNDASGDQVKKAFKQLSLQVHPDRNHHRRAEEASKSSIRPLPCSPTRPRGPRTTQRWRASLAAAAALAGRARPQGRWPLIDAPPAGAAAAARARRRRRHARRPPLPALRPARTTALQLRSVCHDFTKRWRRSGRNEVRIRVGGIGRFGRGGPT